jgi:hypothetical protein
MWRIVAAHHDAGTIPCMAARELPCDILNVENGCTGIGVRPFRHITAFKEPVTILACKPCAAWWRTRHPDA